MSTRSVTTIRSVHGGAVALYRHHDGYPAEAGACLVEATRGAIRVETIAARLLALMYDPTSYAPAREIYELTHSAEGHGDLEHTYEVTGTWSRERNGLVFSVRHGRRPNFDSWFHADYTVPAFAAIVNKERAEINRRLRERGYGESEQLSLVSLEGL